MIDSDSNDKVFWAASHKAPSEGATGTGKVFILLFSLRNYNYNVLNLNNNALNCSVMQWWAVKRWNYQIIFSSMIFSERSIDLVIFK